MVSKTLIFFFFAAIIAVIHAMPSDDVAAAEPSGDRVMSKKSIILNALSMIRHKTDVFCFTFSAFTFTFLKGSDNGVQGRLYCPGNCGNDDISMLD